MHMSPVFFPPSHRLYFSRWLRAIAGKVYCCRYCRLVLRLSESDHLRLLVQILTTSIECSSPLDRRKKRKNPWLLPLLACRLEGRVILSARGRDTVFKNCLQGAERKVICGKSSSATCSIGMQRCASKPKNRHLHYTNSRTNVQLRQRNELRSLVGMIHEKSLHARSKARS